MFTATREVRLPASSPRRSRESNNTPRGSGNLQRTPFIRPGGPDQHDEDPLFIGFPNDSNLCYQNAALQSLLGLPPFLNDMVSLMSVLKNSSCRTSRAVAKLMVLRQEGLSDSVFNHLNDTRDLFGDIDHAFRGTQMQDANEFLLCLLNTIKDEISALSTTANPVRDNFQYQAVERHTCLKCRTTELKRQICWFVSVPRLQGTEVPTL